MSIISVSYTHLDVYKRQRERRLQEVQEHASSLWANKSEDQHERRIQEMREHASSSWATK